MPRQPEPAKNLEHRYNIQTTVPGWLKNDILKICEENETSITQWINHVIHDAVRNNKKLPELTSGTARTPADTIREYLSGERSLQPCGLVSCDRVDVSSDDGSTVFCGPCGIRVF